MLRNPSQFSLKLCRINSIATIVTWTIFYMIEVIFIFTHSFKDFTKNANIVLLTIGSDEVSFADTSLCKNGPHTRRMIFCVNPVAHIQSITIELRAHPRKNIRNLARNELLYMLVWPVIIRAIRNCSAHTKSAMPCTYKQIGARLC